MKGDRVEVVVDTGHGTTTFEITASRAGRRLEVSTARGVVEVTEVTRGGTPVRTGRFMASRVVALVEHPALEATSARVEVETRRRLSPAARRGGRGKPSPSRDQMQLIEDELSEADQPDPIDELRRQEAELHGRDDAARGGDDGASGQAGHPRRAGRGSATAAPSRAESADRRPPARSRVEARAR